MKDVKSLLVFLQVARCGSFVAAAAQLNVSPSAVSISLSRLEKSLGVRLFKRTTRAVQLTVEGQSLYERVGDPLAEVERALDQTRHPNSEPTGLVRLSTITNYGRHVLLPILDEFLTRYPSIDLRISFHDNARDMSRQADDIRITWGEKLEAGKVARALYTLKLVLVASPAYLARSGTPRQPGELEQHRYVWSQLPTAQKPWIFVPGSAAGKRLVTAEPFVFLPPRSQLTIASEIGIVSDAARAGLGLLVTTDYCVEDSLRDGSLVRLLPDYDIQYQGDEIQTQITIQYPSRALMSQRVRVLLDYLLEKLEQRPT